MQQRMEAGINRNSRLWQVPDTADSLMHSLGPAPFEDHPHEGGPEGHTGMQMLQVEVQADGSVVFGPPGEACAASCMCAAWSACMHAHTLLHDTWHGMP